MNKPETRYEASLTEEGRYRLLVESIRDYAIYMLSPEGIISSWNQGAKRVKGYAAHEIIGHHFSRFYTEEDRARGLPTLALKTAARKGTFESEGWRVRKDGSRFWAHVVIDPVRTPDGALVGFAKITRDLTERREAEADLHRSQEQFRLLVQGVTDYAIFMLDPDGRVANWNVGAERLKGYRPEEIVGQHYSRFYTDEERALELPARNLEIAAREGRFEKEGWRVRKDGTQFWANVVIDAIRDPSGTLIGFAKVTRDFTERRANQRALEETREALFQSQKTEAIGQLTGGIAHDFNNLLMVILGSLQMLQRRVPADPKIAALLDNALLAGQRGATLTKRMLMFARRESLAPIPTDLPKLVHGMSDLLRRAIGPTIRIETRFPLSLPAVLVDPNQLETALLNLCLNARDAMPEGGSITILAAEDFMPRLGEPATRCVRLGVSDTGTGMDEHTVKRATEPFFTTKGIGKGTGLGLSMVQGLAEQSNGRLTITSVPGTGTKVEIWLPLADAALEAAAPEAAPLPPVGPLTVLAVDDDPLVLMNLKVMLEDMGHTALTAAAAADAIEVLTRTPGIDLVITDQAMPNMKGHQLALHINAKWPAMPVILATGYAELPSDVATNLPRLPKPYLQNDLEKAIAAAIHPAGGT
jgi:PAS domain S-box-containing protein